MFLVSTSEDAANPVGELVSAEQPLGLCDLALAVDPGSAGLYGIEPRALGRQKAGHYPYPSFATVIFDSAVVGSDPVAHLMAFVPGGFESQTKSRAFLPLSWSLWHHQERNCVVLWRSPAYRPRTSEPALFHPR